MFQNRLFSYLQKQLNIPIKEILQIRKQVYKVNAEGIDFILKGFSSYHQLVLQKDFLTWLKREGFQKTYSFYPLEKNPPLLFEQTYYGCLEFIETSKNEFTFYKQSDRLNGLKLLSHFHDVNEKLVKQYTGNIPSFNQLGKWQERTMSFLNNLPVIRYFVQKEIINDMLIWADWSLKGLEKELNVFENGKKVILHGDVAHHNFLRSKNKDIYLIDFDLISIGTPRSDCLQYANRILPFIHWSFQELGNYKEIAAYLNEKGFIYALAFPTDIFREWNRAIREQTYLQSTKIQQLLEMTVGQFQQRHSFIKELQRFLHVK
ncbi:phosphotransferase [Cytobacillus massiliigabonensis]|uniref:phosphotransferase n=1 Tax=Cytobacillus massiliigabonensis TaxID=1871011 RepID=UPI001F291AB2|nr:phosphotransferase [Cytobacillus massiliigabonensis]